MTSLAEPTEPLALDALYADFAAAHMAPLWTQRAGLMPVTPQPSAVPTRWHWSTLLPLAQRAGELVPVGRGGERRAIALVNPGLPGTAYATPTLWAAIQYLGPREEAPAHRHAQTAFRFVVEGEGVWTNVEGSGGRVDAIAMRRGDLLLTPGMHWHEHHNTTDHPMAWVDGLDIPLVRQLDAGFFEFGPEVLATTETPATSRGERLWGHPGLTPLGDAPGRVSPLKAYRCSARSPRSAATPAGRCTTGRRSTPGCRAGSRCSATPRTRCCSTSPRARARRSRTRAALGRAVAPRRHGRGLPGRPAARPPAPTTSFVYRCTQRRRGGLPAARHGGAVGVVGSTALKLSDGLRRPLPLLGTVAGYGVATVALGLLMEHLAVGVVYAVWGGGAALSLTIVGRVVFGERITARAGRGRADRVRRRADPPGGGAMSGGAVKVRSPWWPMAGAIGAEVVATLLLKASDGFGRPLLGALAPAGFGLALWFLSAALRALPISVAYPVWIGVGSVAVTLAGAVLFGEWPGLGALAGIGLVAVVAVLRS